MSVSVSMNRNPSRSRLLKVVLLGDGKVGKSSLMNRYVSNKFDAQSFHTIGVEFLNKEVVVDDFSYTIQVCYAYVCYSALSLGIHSMLHYYIRFLMLYLPWCWPMLLSSLLVLGNVQIDVDIPVANVWRIYNAVILGSNSHCAHPS